MPDDEFMITEESQELFREWEADHHAARVRDYDATDAATYGQRVKEGAMMPLTSEPPHPWPSEIADEVRNQPANGNGNDHGKDGGYSM